MAESVKVKWRFCSICRRNHDEGRKHIFTAGHKAKLSTLMTKFIKKVSMLTISSENGTLEYKHAITKDGNLFGLNC